MPAGVTGKISFSQPNAASIALGIHSIDQLLESANRALEEAGLTVWILFDRLDVAFSDSPDLEVAGLRALFREYLDPLGAATFP